MSVEAVKDMLGVNYDETISTDVAQVQMSIKLVYRIL